MNSLTIANAQLQHQKERPAKRVTYNPVTGLTDQVPAMPLDSALSSSSTNPVQNRAISEAVIELTNKASHNAAGIEHNAGDISLLNERINNNSIAIQHNANDIAELDTKTNALTATVANVSEDMETVNSNMTALDDKVDTFSDAIEQNTRDIQKNKRDIQHNTDEIARVEEEISDVSEILVTVREHTVEIAALDDKVNTNTANIATNTTAISDEVTRATAAEGALQTAVGNIPVVTANVSDTATETLSNIKIGNTVYDASASGVPLGTWVAFDDGITPDENYLEAGTTFDENTYPELYLHLGSNTVPERFDHNKLGDRQTISLNVSAANAPVMPYDGVVWVICNPTTTGNSNVVLRINEQEMARQSSSGGNQSSVFSTVKKGEKVRVSTDNGAITSYIAYYTKKLYIKATPINAPIVIPSAEVQEIKNYTKNYVDANNSYSTSEIATGGTWIDGKPIYRKCLTATNITSGTEISVVSLGIDSLIKLYGTLVDSVNGNKIVVGNYYNLDYMYCGAFYKKSNDTLRFQKGSDVSSTNVAAIVLEYTKS